MDLKESMQTNPDNLLVFQSSQAYLMHFWITANAGKTQHYP